MDCEVCGDDPVYWVEEKYLAPDGATSVDRLEPRCPECVKDAEPNGLDNPLWPNYEYKITMITEDLY